MGSIETDQFTLSESYLDVGEGHTLYMQLWGNPVADRKIINLHGGPGSGTDEYHKQMYDPATQQVIFFDQRGSGKSTPYGSIENNTTPDLVGDIDKVADNFNIDRFELVGRSWGSCLALVYAIQDQARVDRLVIGGVFTARQVERDHFYKGGFRKVFPEVWEQYVATVPEEHRDNPSEYHLERILGNNSDAARLSAFAIEKAGASLESPTSEPDIGTVDEFDPAGLIVQCHYDVNKEFIPEGFILSNAHKLNIPVDIVQGRYDMLCPPVTAYDAGNRIANSTLTLTVGPHSGSHPANLEVMRRVIATS